MFRFFFSNLFLGALWCSFLVATRAHDKGKEENRYHLSISLSFPANTYGLHEVGRGTNTVAGKISFVRGFKFFTCEPVSSFFSDDVSDVSRVLFSCSSVVMPGRNNYKSWKKGRKEGSLVLDSWQSYE